MTDREAMQIALEALEMCSSALAEELAAWDIDPPLHHVLQASNACEPAINSLLWKLEQPEQEPVRWKNTVRALTDQCAALIRERDNLQKQIWRYEQNGVTCQTYRHTVEQSCSECNVYEKYNSPPQRLPLTDEQIEELDDQVRQVTIDKGSPVGWFAMQLARAIEQAHGIGGKP